MILVGDDQQLSSDEDKDDVDGDRRHAPAAALNASVLSPTSGTPCSGEDTPLSRFSASSGMALTLFSQSIKSESSTPLSRSQSLSSESTFAARAATAGIPFTSEFLDNRSKVTDDFNEKSSVQRDADGVSYMTSTFHERLFRVRRYPPPFPLHYPSPSPPPCTPPPGPSPFSPPPPLPPANA